MTDTPADATHVEEIKKGETVGEIPVEEKPVTTTGDVKEHDVEDAEEEGEVDDMGYEEEGEEEGDMEFEEDMVHDDAVRFYEEHGELIEGDGDIVEIHESEDGEGEAEGDEEPAAKRAKTDEPANEEDAA